MDALNCRCCSIPLTFWENARFGLCAFCRCEVQDCPSVALYAEFAGHHLCLDHYVTCLEEFEAVKRTVSQEIRTSDLPNSALWVRIARQKVAEMVIEGRLGGDPPPDM